MKRGEDGIWRTVGGVPAHPAYQELSVSDTAGPSDHAGLVSKLMAFHERLAHVRNASDMLLVREAIAALSRAPEAVATQVEGGWLDKYGNLHLSEESALASKEAVKPDTPPDGWQSVPTPYATPPAPQPDTGVSICAMAAEIATLKKQVAHLEAELTIKRFNGVHRVVDKHLLLNVGADMLDQHGFSYQANVLREQDAEIETVRCKAQSYYELLRECQSEFRAKGAAGMVDTIDEVLAGRSALASKEGGE